MRAIIQWMLGTWGRSLSDFLESNPTFWTILVGVWFALYLAAKWQLEKVRRKTEAMTLEHARRIMANKPNVTPSGIYKQMLPNWKNEVSAGVLFIPNKLELWPMKATPENIMMKLNFNPEWVADLIRKKGIGLQDGSQNDPKDDKNASDLSDNN